MRLLLSSIILLIVQCCSDALQAQDIVKPLGFTREGQLLVTWGYNRSQYSRSDIHLKGAGYDFTLHDVKASDRPSNFSAALFINPFNISIPQFDFRIGYYVTDRLCVSFGFDHMKYVVRQRQDVLISGNIDHSASEEYAGNYSNEHILIRHSFFDYEHTNGLNYFSFTGEYLMPLLKSRNEKFRIHLELGGGAAWIMPKTDAFLFSVRGDNVYHLAGYGLDFNTGFRFDFGKHFLLRACVKGGFIDLPSVITYKSANNSAKQHFFFLQEYATLGYAFRIK